MLRDRRVWLAGAVAAVVVALIAVSSPAGTAAKEHEMGPGDNHHKCYQILDWTEFEPRKVELKDQFGSSIATVMEPYQLCNPVDKNGEGIPDPKNHLVCYQIRDDPQSSTPRVKEVEIGNQFQQGPLWVGSANTICVPSEKSYQQRG